MEESKKIIFGSTRVIVRELKKSDFHDLFELYSKEETFKYEFEHPLEHYDLEDYLKDIMLSYKYEYPSYYLYGIEFIEEKKIVGIFTYSYIDPKGIVCDIGGWVNSDYWNRGIAKEVGKEALKYLFSKNIEKVSCGSFFENKQSIKLIETLGFKKEGHVRKAIWLKERFFDEVLYGYFKSDYQDLK